MNPEGPLVPDDLADREYDFTSRHLLMARIVDLLTEPGDRVLDIGGSEGVTARFLPERRVVAADVRMEMVDVAASGDRLPFRDQSFSVAVFLDVFEHVTSDIRDDLIDEAARTADAVVITGPFADPAVVKAEDQQRAIFEALTGRQHNWLEEHAGCGLPSLKDTTDRLEHHGLTVTSFGSNPLDLWSALLAHAHIALRMGVAGAAHSLRSSMLQDFLEKADATPPSYRQIIVAARRPDISSLVDQVKPGTDRAATDAAIQAVEVDTGRVIGSSIDTLRGELEQGWHSSVEHAGALQQALDSTAAKWSSTVEHAGALQQALDSTAAKWSSTVDDYHDLERKYAIEVERYRATAKNLAASDEVLMANPTAWLTNVSLPGAASRLIRPDNIDAYDLWLQNRPSLPQPMPPTGPMMSILVPVFNPQAEFLEACIRSVRSQTYESWELVLMNASDEPHVIPICERFAAVDPRIKILEGENRGIAANTNAAASGASGAYFILLDHDDELAPQALAAVAAALIQQPDSGVIYSDEDSIDVEGRRSDPFFKPAWSPDLLRHLNYITHLMVIERDLWVDMGGMRSEYDGAQDYDLALRATHAAGGATHVPDVLYHWRRHDDSTASDVMTKPYAHFAGRRALDDFVSGVVPGARVEFGTGPTSHRVRYPIHDTKITAIIPFKDEADLTEQCLTSIAKTRGDVDLEVLLVDNRSVEEVTQKRILDWESRWPWVRIVAFNEPFNFQKMNNWAVEQSRGSTLLFLNNDTQAAHAGWLEPMLEHAQRPEIGAVGARLFFPDGTIQHAGAVVGIGGYADHPWARLAPAQWTAAGPSYWTRNFVAVTAACLMIERSKFEEVGGFDERFTIGGGDVALGIRLSEAGYWNVFTPFARLIHHESITRGQTVPSSDLTESLRAYGPYLDGRDPFYNPNLSLEGTAVEVDATANAPNRRRLIVARGPREDTNARKIDRTQ